MSSSDMARYPLNLPAELKREAERWAALQGVSLNQFILWAVSEKVGALAHQLDDPRFPHVGYRRSLGGQPVPFVRGSEIRVQTVVVAAEERGWNPAEIGVELGLAEAKVKGALAFYEAHRDEVRALIAAHASDRNR